MTIVYRFDFLRQLAPTFLSCFILKGKVGVEGTIVHHLAITAWVEKASSFY